jgi:2-amino-4-hydroxy-6-hydroxymethyldihydropteridine diphosphokinase
MHRRAFVLVPLSDIAPPGLWIPGRGALGVLLSGLDRSGIDPLPSAAAAGETRQAELC